MRKFPFLSLLALIAVPFSSHAQIPATPTPVPSGPTNTSDKTSFSDRPNVYTNETNRIAPGSPGRAIGSVESGNSTVPFTVEAVSLKVAGGQAVLELAFTNGSSGPLDASGLFTAGVSDTGNPRQISGVYLEDPVSKQKFEVVRNSGSDAQCSTITTPFAAGERRMLQAHFSKIPAGVKSVYIYFPHAAPIADVAVTR